MYRCREGYFGRSAFESVHST